MISLIVFATLLFLPITLQGGCPVRCNCTENSVTCVSRGMEYVPYFESLSNTPIIIDLSGNTISIIDIDDFSFEKSDQVKEIYLNSSGVTVVEEKAFEELESLQELYLADNFLSNLPENFIAENANMILLDISSNYFVDFPKIKSDSLEVLAVANSQVHKIANDALDGLTNLRVLLLQQNNLKHVNAMAFQKVPNLFFVRMTYNPWLCNCRTVDLFNYLTDKGLVDLSEPIQCHTIEKEFIDIYDQNGVTETFQNQCPKVGDNQPNNNQLKAEDLTKSLKEDEVIEAILHNYEDQDDDTSLTGDPEIYNFFYCFIIFAAVFMSLIIGAVLGSYFTYRYLIVNLRLSESQKELLQSSEA